MPNEISRRDFFRQGALTGGSLWMVLALPEPKMRGAVEEPERPAVLKGIDRKTVRAITGRILPTDDDPGAIEADCVAFIDKALANEEKEAQAVYVAGLAALRALCQERSGKHFFELPPDEQDGILAALESGEVEGWSAPDVAPEQFFEILRLHTILGYLSDPAYGGNRDYAGWKVVGYPAPRRQSGITAKQLVGEDPVEAVWEQPVPRRPGQSPRIRS